MAKAKTTTSTSRPKARKGAVVPPTGAKITAAERLDFAQAHKPDLATAALVLADGSVFWGRGFGATATNVGEVCFNTSITGYQEILTDPSYAGQIITFTFPHIGNTGTNAEDIETLTPAARGLIVRADITDPANWRAIDHLDPWLKGHELPGISGIDTRALTARIRDGGAPNGAIGFTPKGKLDIRALQAQAAGWSGLEGTDLAREVTCGQSYSWTETDWTLGQGYGTLTAPRFKVVAMDFGAKRNILRCLAALGCDVTVVPADTSAAEIMRHEPDGIFLSNGPGRPGGDGNLCGAGDPRTGPVGQAGVRHLPRPPAAVAGARCQDTENGHRTSRRQSPGQGPEYRQGRNHQPEPRLRGAR